MRLVLCSRKQASLNRITHSLQYFFLCLYNNNNNCIFLVEFVDLGIGGRYAFIFESTTWEEAVYQCSSRGATLVTIDTETKEEAILNYLVQHESKIRPSGMQVTSIQLINTPPWYYVNCKVFPYIRILHIVQQLFDHSHEMYLNCDVLDIASRYNRRRIFIQIIPKRIFYDFFASQCTLTVCANMIYMT